MTDPEPTKSEAGLEERLIACGENCDHSSIRCIDLHREAVVALNSLRAEVERLRGTTELEVALAAFRELMLAKFHKRAERNPETDVTIHGKSRLVQEHIDSHYRAEMVERLEAPDAATAASEDVDVANLAFLSWWTRQPGAALARKEEP